MGKRIFLFLLTNLAIVLTLSIVLSVLGVGRYISPDGTLNIEALAIFCFVWGMGGAFISLALSRVMAKWAMGVQVIEPNTSNAQGQLLLQTVGRLARSANIPMPEVGVYASPDINAFATGPTRSRSLVAVSTGLLEKMDRSEAEGVLGHEVSHIANGDMVTLALIQGVVNTFVIFLSRVIGHLVDRIVFKVERGHGPAFWITAIIAQVVLGILATTIVMWFSRQREFRADAGGARLAGREKMIAALERLKLNYEGPAQLPDQIAAFGISGGVSRGLKRLFMSHPPLDERIAALRNQ